MFPLIEPHCKFGAVDYMLAPIHVAMLAKKKSKFVAILHGII